MKLGKVIGNYVSGIEYSGLIQSKLLVVQPLEFDLTPLGEPFIAADSVGAGAGEYVFWVSGMEATFPFEDELIPVDACIVGIVDEIRLEAVCDLCRRLNCPRMPGDPPERCINR